MDVTDVVDLVSDLLPHGIRRLVAASFLLLYVLAPATAASVVTWYATQKAHSIEQEFNRVVLPQIGTPSPVQNRP